MGEKNEKSHTIQTMFNVMKNHMFSVCLIVLAVSVIVQPALAHFQVLIPSTDIVTAEGSRSVDFTIIFTHPMEQGPIMNMGPPSQFGVIVMGQKKDLRDTLVSQETDGQNTYTASYTPKRPGDHVFYLEPAAYWEPAEEVMIIHYTKTVVNAMGAEEGWDTMVGFPVEIEPLSRPYGLWTGNAFRGIVKKDKQPFPFAEIEVEYYNEGSRVEIPADPFITQVIKADANGVFSYVMPKAGWWSFAALIEGDETMQNPDGKEVGVELGALIWVKTVDMK
jgi:cobalt/nickel transport protein